MTMEIRLYDHARSAADDASDLLRSVSGDEPRRSDAPPRTEVMRGDPIAVAALVLSIPGAIVGVMDLAQRTRLAERVRRLRERLRASGGSATLHAGSLPPLDLTVASEDEVVDLLARSSSSAPERPRMRDGRPPPLP